MAIKIGTNNNNLAKIYIGSTEVSKVYVGSTLLWSGFTPLTYWNNVGYYGGGDTLNFSYTLPVGDLPYLYFETIDGTFQCTATSFGVQTEAIILLAYDPCNYKVELRINYTVYSTYLYINSSVIYEGGYIGACSWDPTSSNYDSYWTEIYTSNT